MTKQPRKQRKRSETAAPRAAESGPATLTDELREEYGPAERPRQRRRYRRGTSRRRGRHGAEVISVDLSAERITVEDVTVEKADGEEVPRPIPASNVRVAELDLEDERREARLQEDNE